MFLSDRDSGEGLDFLFVCGRGARVFKLIEELKDKRPECRSSVGGRGPSPRWTLKCKAGLPAKAPRPCLFWSPRTPTWESEVRYPMRPSHRPSPLFCSSSHVPSQPGWEDRALGPRVPPRGSHDPAPYRASARTTGPIPPETQYARDRWQAALKVAIFLPHKCHQDHSEHPSRDRLGRTWNPTWDTARTHNASTWLPVPQWSCARRNRLAGVP